ncbi:unnamed protein product [Spirodela intermedia]|uniref:Uncharacterized protein n=1 Tax=Spirodela intermedia TaxID=51605 RepID=A0A7I8IZS9_SPIIN|nr:unnamed protein product [Spirodela intermedia]CAA6663464.1 unnamed protein product [Spirodela intermedia]
MKQSLLIGGSPYQVIVTNKQNEAGDWVQELFRLPREETTVVGVSFSRCNETIRGETILQWINSIHLACSSRALVYHLTSSADGSILPRQLLFILCDPSYLFIGEEIISGLELLGLKTKPPLMPTLDLRDVPASSASLDGPSAPNGVHCTLRFSLLPSWTWPLNDDKVEEAVQTAVVAEKIGKRVIKRTNVSAIDQRMHLGMIRTSLRDMTTDFAPR